MKKLLLKLTLLLCALIVGSSAWAQSDKSETYTSNVTLSTTGGTSASNAKVKLSSSGTEYSAIKAGTSSKSGAVKITVPSGAKYLHLHVAGWNGESVTVSVTPNTNISPKSITLTADAGISGSSTTYTLSTPANATTNYYKVITFTNALTANTDFTFAATSGKRFVIWGVNTEEEATTHTLTYSATNGNIGGVIYNTSTAVASGASVAEGGKVTLTADPASGYAFTGWSVEGTGASLSSTSTNPTTFTMGTANATVTANFEASSTVVNPTFTVPEGTYNEAQSVEINCPTNGATIYYTTDGSDPTTSSTEYTGAISVTQTTTIKAFAVKAGMTNSGIASATYTLKCATPTITVPAGVFLDTKEVTMTSTDGAAIYYTTDGSTTPTSSSTAYDPSNKPSISATTTFKAIATKSGWSDSEVASATFTKIVPKTVGEALTAIAALANNGTINDQYVSGIVCTAGTLSSGAITYYISSDGTETNRLQVYKGKGLNNTDFEAASDIAVGDAVIVFGQLKKYVSGSNTTPEFNSGNYLISKVTKEAPTFSLDITEKTLDAYTKKSVDVTLTTNTDGEISCESNNEDVATVVLKSGNVYTITAKTEGTATITIRSAASATYKPASATVAITVEDERAEAGISFTDDEKAITWGDSFTGQALTNDNSVDVVWSSTDEDVATVNSTGAVEVLKAGTTTIKATFSGDATYKAAVASYTLTVNKANAGLSYATTSYDIMLNDDTFEAPTLNNPNGLTVTYASNKTDVATVNATTGELSYVAIAEGTAKITATFTGNDWYKSGSANYTINIVDPTVKGCKYNPYTVAEVIDGTATGSGIYVTGFIVGEYPSGEKPIITSSFTTDANIALADVYSTSTAKASAIPVQISSDALKAAWGNKSNDGSKMGYKVLIKGNKDTYFSVNGIKSTSEVTALSIPVTVGAAGYTTFVPSSAVEIPFGVKGYIITATGADNVTLTEKTSVPASTPIIIEAAAGNYNMPVITTSPDDVSGNLLQASDGTVTGDESTIFALGKKDDKVGFYLVANGQTVPAGKAYLEVAGDANVKGFLAFDFGTTDAIKMVQGAGLKDAAIFNLAGQRMSKLQRGLNIVNGKKYIVK